MWYILGDLIGILCLFGLLYVGLFAANIFS